MALPCPSYLRLSRHNVFYFRWPIPACLHPHGRAQHVETSLRTRNPRLALQMARHLAYHAENITGHMLDMNHAEIKTALQAFFADKLADFKKRREHTGSLPKWMEDKHRLNLQAFEQAIGNGTDGRLAFDGNEPFQQHIDEIIHNRNLPITKDSREYELLMQEHIHAYAQHLRDMLAYNTSLKDYGHTPAPSLALQSTAISGITLKQAVDDFIAERQRGQMWTARTLKDRTAQLVLLCEILGDTIDVSTVTAHKADEVRKILQSLPKNRNKNPKTRDLSLKDMLTVSDVEKMDVRTVNEYLRRQPERLSPL